jgi:hypothetical protein
MHDDIRPAIRKCLCIVDLSDTSNPSGLEIGFRRSLRPEHYPELRVSADAIGEHLPVARLEDVQRERRSRKQHERERKKREEVNRHPRKVQHRRLRRCSLRRLFRRHHETQYVALDAILERRGHLD